MISKIIDAQIDPRAMQAKTVLRDDFGNEAVVQSRLTDPYVNHASDVAAMIAVMLTNENTFVGHLEAMGLTAEQIDGMKAK